MVKNLLFICAIGSVLFLFVPPDKDIHFTMSQQEFWQLWGVINASAAPHNIVYPLQTKIMNQVKPQIDSLPK